MKKKPVGFGIVGAGVISDFHAKAIAAIENAGLVGVFSINKDKADIFANRHNCAAYNSVDDLVNNSSIDIVCICTPSGIHLEPALKCIEAGKHCLIEKPLEISLKRCDQIIEATLKAGVKTGVIFPSRFHEVNKQLKQSIMENRFGEMVLGDAYVKWSRSEAYYKSAKWRGTWEYDGGGALMNQGIHSVDLLQWFMGPVESVQAITTNVRHKDIEVEDTVVAILKFANGALGTIECSTAIFPGFFKRIEIMGTSGSAVIEENSLVKWQFEKEIETDDAIRNTFSAVNSSQGGASDPSAISFLGHQKQMEDMIQAIENNANPLIDAVEGRKSVEIVTAIYKSAILGKAIKLPYSG